MLDMIIDKTTKAVLTVGAVTTVEAISVYNMDNVPRDYEIFLSSGTDKVLIGKGSAARWSMFTHNSGARMLPGDSIILKTDGDDYRVSFLTTEP